MSLPLSLFAAAAIFGLLALNGWCLRQIASQNGRLSLRVDALAARLAARPSHAAGTPVAAQARPVESGPGRLPPKVGLTDLDGRSVALDGLGPAGLPVALVVTDPRCGPCAEVLPDVARWQRDYADRLTIALVSAGTAEANRTHLAGHAIERVLLQRELELVHTYGLTQAPAVIFVRPDGSLDGAAAYGAPAIRTAIAQAAGAPIPAPPPPAGGDDVPVVALATGDPIPSLRLPDLDGHTVDLADLNGAPTLLLFWSPYCGHCQRLGEELKARGAGADGAPRLVVLSRGTAEANRAVGLPVPVLLDDGLVASRAFGVQGTPSAVLIDAQGQIAAEIVRGSRAVSALLATR